MEANFLESEVQWIGRSKIGNGPLYMTVVNYEPRFPQHAQIVAVSLDSMRLTQASDADMEVKGGDVSGTSYNYRIFDPQEDRMIPLAEYYERHEIKGTPPTKASYTGKINGVNLIGEYKNDLGELGNFSSSRNFAGAFSDPPASKPEIIGPLDWDEFKHTINAYRQHGRHIFRGQHSNQYPLRTAFHRAKRNNLVRYVEEDIPRLRHRLNAISSHYYQSSGERLFSTFGGCAASWLSDAPVGLDTIAVRGSIFCFRLSESERRMAGRKRASSYFCTRFGSMEEISTFSGPVIKRSMA